MRGETYITNDPAGMMTRTDRDDAGRVIRTTSNTSRPAPAPPARTGPCNCPPPSPLRERVGRGVSATRQRSKRHGPTCYTPDGNVASLTALNPVTGPQATRYLYGTTLEAVPGTTGGNVIARNDLLVGVLYPDASDSADRVRFAYNLQSQVNWMQDQNGTVHGYSFDGLGRRAADIILAFGPNVDQSTPDHYYGYEISRDARER